MRQVSLAELERDADAIVEAVEHGETLVLTRGGEPILRLEPARERADENRDVDAG